MVKNKSRNCKLSDSTNSKLNFSKKNSSSEKVDVLAQVVTTTSASIGSSSRGRILRNVQKYTADNSSSVKANSIKELLAETEKKSKTDKNPSRGKTSQKCTDENSSAGVNSTGLENKSSEPAPSLSDSSSSCSDVDVTSDFLHDDPKLAPASSCFEKADSKTKTKAKKSKKTQKQPLKKPSPSLKFDMKRVRELNSKYPQKNTYIDYENSIQIINQEFPLIPRPEKLFHPGSLYSMTLNSDGSMLATFSTFGSIRLWDCENWTLLSEIFDKSEDTIYDFYHGRFTPDSRYIIAGGKAKDRNRWSSEDEDNAVLPCPLVVFDFVERKVVARHLGHQEEILFIELVPFQGANYLLSASQDGKIIRWQMDASWTRCIRSQPMQDPTTCMAFGVAMIPNCGNKYFAAACDEGICVFDFEHCTVVHSFPHLYTSYCDFVHVVGASGLPETLPPTECYLMTRGVEILDNAEEFMPKVPNSCNLFKLGMPTSADSEWQLSPVRKYQDDFYHANSWLQKLGSNGRYVVAPTVQGEVFIWNIGSGALVGKLKNHEDREVRDVIFHPTKKIMLTCADDGYVQIYTQ